MRGIWLKTSEKRYRHAQVDYQLWLKKMDVSVGACAGKADKYRIKVTPRRRGKDQMKKDAEKGNATSKTSKSNVIKFRERGNTMQKQMEKKRAVVMLLVIVALVAVSLYGFGTKPAAQGGKETAAGCSKEDLKVKAIGRAKYKTSVYRVLLEDGRTAYVESPVVGMTLSLCRKSEGQS